MNKFSKKYLDKYYSQLINKFESQNYSYEISQIAQKLKIVKLKREGRNIWKWWKCCNIFSF